MSLRGKLILNYAIAVLLFSSTSGFAQQLSWGVGGTGGTGPWDTTTANWWNGSANVPWVDGAIAVFSGTPGTATIGTSQQKVGGIIFNSAGFVVTGGYGLTANSTFDIVANADGEFSTSIYPLPGTTLTKYGQGVLTYGTGFPADTSTSVVVAEGALRTSSTTAPLTLANAAGVKVLLSNTNSYAGHLFGGGNLGGVVQPDAGIGATTLTLTSSSNFNGQLKDNASAALSLAVKTSYNSDVVELTNSNPYSGSTAVSTGRLTLSGNGALTGTGSLAISSSLWLDNGTTALETRLPVGAPIELAGGTIELLGNVGTAVHQSLGALTVSAKSSLIAQSAGAETALDFSSFLITRKGSLDITGSGAVRLPGVSTNAGGILPPYITSGVDWTTLAADGSVKPYTAYSGFESGGATSNVKLAGGGTTTLAAPASRFTLNFQNSDAAPAILDLGGNNLILGGAGIMTSGTGSAQITNGTLSSDAGLLEVNNRTAFIISANLAEGASPLGLNKRGAGTLTLLGTNNYSGSTDLIDGVLATGSAAGLGTGSLIFDGGTLRALGSFSLAQGVSGYAKIDTNGFDLAIPSFSGLTTINKSGAGALTVTNFNGTAYVMGGSLNLGVSPAGYTNITMFANTVLQAEGHLLQFGTIDSARLDLGGRGADSLLIDNFAPRITAGAKLTLDFDIGGTAQDFLSLGSIGSGTISSAAAGYYVMDFHDLGGTQTGVSYPIISITGHGTLGILPANTLFTLSPADLAAGWRASFTSTSTQVAVTFASTPEPGSAVLLAGASVIFARRRRRRPVARLVS